MSFIIKSILIKIQMNFVDGVNLADGSGRMTNILLMHYFKTAVPTCLEVELDGFGGVFVT